MTGAEIEITPEMIAAMVAYARSHYRWSEGLLADLNEDDARNLLIAAFGNLVAR